MTGEPDEPRPSDEPEWRRGNRGNWDERARLHLAPGGYDLTGLRAGTDRLNGIEEAELGPVDGLRLLHLQCHFGRDSLMLAQAGASVTGLDFSGEAIQAARALADELGLSGRARFVEADLYAAPRALPEPASFDRVFVTWGAINWLPDIVGWARVVAHFLRPGGALYLLDQHPAMFVFDDATATPDGRPGWFWPYFAREPLIDETARDNFGRRIALGGPDHVWVHPLGAIVTSLIDAGMTLRWLHEHDAIAWPAFSCLVEGHDGLWRWPDRPWLPLSFSLWAERS
jgi:SAM-dependent methyltransferase